MANAAVDIAVQQIRINCRWQDSPTTTWNYGTQYPYRIWVSNNGPDNATGVIITDTLPVGVVFDHASISIPIHGTWSYNDTTKTLTWNIGNLLAGESAGFIDIFVNVTGHNTTITNNATGNSTEYDWNTTNNIGSWTTNIPAAAHVDLDKFYTDYDQFVNNSFNIVPITQANYLETVIVMLKATNIGPDTAVNLGIRDTWPADLNRTGDYWCSYDGTTWTHYFSGMMSGNGNFTWAPAPPLTAGSSQYVGYAAQVNKSNTTITNNLTTITQTTYDPVGWDSVNATLNVPPAAFIELDKEWWSDLNGTEITQANYLDWVYAIVEAENDGT